MPSSGPRRQAPAYAAQRPLTLLKYLQDRGVDSRRRIMDAIIGGQVTVNERVVRDSGYQVTPQDRVAYGNSQAPARARQPIYLMMNKPQGTITTTRDERGRPTVIDLLPERLRGEHVFPVGRLDADTDGLLLLTNDGDLTLHLTHPRYEVEKEYLVETDHRVADHDLQALRNGVRLEDGTTAPASIRLVSGAPQWRYALSIHEGKKRQVRRMFQHLGYRVDALTRIRVKDLVLGDLAPGAVRALTAREVRSLRS